MAGTNCIHAVGQPAQEMVDDRDVVGGQVPQHVDVALKQAQVNPDAVNVVQLAELPRVNDLLDLLDGGAVHIGVVDHQDQAAGCGQIDQRLGVRSRMGQRLFNQHVFSGLKCGRGDVCMRRDGRRHGNRRDVLALQDLLKLLEHVNVRIPLVDFGQPLGVGVADSRHPSQRALGKVTHQIRAPVAGPDHSDSSHDSSFEGKCSSIK